MIFIKVFPNVIGEGHQINVRAHSEVIHGFTSANASGTKAC
jgi:hypothetical protein